MALFDNYQQKNSSYISQFAGSIVPETAGFVSNMKNRYEEAQGQDDLLLEAMGNMTHLQDEADTVYANELKQDYSNRMVERVKKGDYENMGRWTKRDAKAFVSEYKPLVNRLQAFQEIQQRVLSDDNISSPEKKSQILSYIKNINQAPKNADGSYRRDGNGRVALTPIQDWAYAKDVDVDKKLVDILKEVEAELTQSGFSPDGQGLMVSQTNEVRTKEDMYQMALQRIQTDPEIKAMLKRDATLATYNLSGQELDMAVVQRNRSKYDELVGQGLKPDQIKQMAVNSGLTVEDLKVKPFNMIAQAYAKQGISPEQAKKDFLRVRVEQELGEPHADLVSNILKVSKRKVDARQDPTYAAKLKFEYDKRLKDYEAELEKAEIIQQYIDEPEASTTDYVDLNKNFKEANEGYMGAVTMYKNGLGDILGNKPTIQSGKEEIDRWGNEMDSYLNSPMKQAELLSNISDQRKKSEVQALFNQHNQALAKLTSAKSSVEAIPQSVYNNALDKSWNKYLKSNSDPGSREYKTKEQYQKHIDKVMKESDLTSGPLGRGWKDSKKGAFDWFSPATDEFIREMNKGVKENIGRTRTPVSVFEPYGTGYVKDQTQMFTNLATGNPNAFTSSGKSLNEYVTKMVDDLGWDEKEIRTYYSNMRVRMADKLSNEGSAQFAISLPDGSTKMFNSSAFGPNKSREMASRMMQSSAHAMTNQEYNYQVSNVARSLSKDEMPYTNPIVLDNARVGQTVQLNDKYAFRIKNSAKGSIWGSPTSGDLLIKNERTGKFESFKNAEGKVDKSFDNLTIEQLEKTLGVEAYRSLLRSGN